MLGFYVGVGPRIRASGEMRVQSAGQLIRSVNQSFSSLKELSTAIEDYLAERDLNPKRYVWKASGEAILAKIQKARAAQTKVNINE